MEVVKWDQIGQYLSVRDKLLLKYYLLVLKDENNLVWLKFWGRINGIKSDYYVLIGRERSENAGSIGDLKYYYSLLIYLNSPSLNLLDWTLLPELQESATVLSKNCNELFSGVPSHVVYFSSIEEGCAESQFTESLKEEDRLRSTIKLIDEGFCVNFIDSEGIKNICITNNNILDCLSEIHNFKLPDSKTIVNCDKIVCSEEDASYWDTRTGLRVDFPSESWHLDVQCGGEMVQIISLIWPGLRIVLNPSTLDHEIIYFGDGRKNNDIYFMIH